MKKILLMLSLIMTMLLCNWTIVSAEEVEGLSEALDKIIMDRNFTQEQFDEMDRQYIEQFDQWFWNEYLPATKKLGRVNTSDDEEYKNVLDRSRPNYTYGILVTNFKNKYARQYSEHGVFNYLFDNNQYWVTVHQNGIGMAAAFSLNGTRIYDYNTITITQEMIDFLKDEKSIEDQLLAKGETKVDDLKVFSVRDGLTLFYIRCDSNEYLIKLCGYTGAKECIPQIQEYTLYPAQEVIEALASHDGDDWHYRQLIARDMVQTKPVYTTEAQSLQEEGLLTGNENGLDLLKPLTRIEATAILVRAMGLEDTQTSAISYFADIQSDNWGAKYANIAKDKGITTGIGDDLFAPNDTITASQFATLILRNMGENPDWQTAINTFVERGLITSEQAEKMDLFTRGDMAKIIYETQQRGLLR